MHFPRFKWILIFYWPLFCMRYLSLSSIEIDIRLCLPLSCLHLDRAEMSFSLVTLIPFWPHSKHEICLKLFILIQRWISTNSRFVYSSSNQRERISSQKCLMKCGNGQTQTFFTLYKKMQFKNVLIFLSLISIVRKDKEILFARQRNRHFNYSFIQCWIAVQWT